MDRTAAVRARSQAVAEASQEAVLREERRRLESALAAGCRANAAQDLTMAREWEHLDEEAWAADQ